MFYQANFVYQNLTAFQPLRPLYMTDGLCDRIVHSDLRVAASAQGVESMLASLEARRFRALGLGLVKLSLLAWARSCSRFRSGRGARFLGGMVESRTKRKPNLGRHTRWRVSNPNAPGRRDAVDAQNPFRITQESLE